LDHERGVAKYFSGDLKGPNLSFAAQTRKNFLQTTNFLQSFDLVSPTHAYTTLSLEHYFGHLKRSTQSLPTIGQILQFNARYLHLDMVDSEYTLPPLRPSPLTQAERLKLKNYISSCGHTSYQKPGRVAPLMAGTEPANTRIFKERPIWITSGSLVLVKASGASQRYWVGKVVHDVRVNNGACSIHYYEKIGVLTYRISKEIAQTSTHAIHDINTGIESNDVVQIPEKLHNIIVERKTKFRGFPRFSTKIDEGDDQLIPEDDELDNDDEHDDDNGEDDDEDNYDEDKKNHSLETTKGSFDYEIDMKGEIDNKNLENFMNRTVCEFGFEIESSHRMDRVDENCKESDYSNIDSNDIDDDDDDFYNDNDDDMS